MTEEHRTINYGRLALGAGLLAVAAVSVAAFVPRRRFAMVTEPLRDVLNWPVVSALALWATTMWEAAPRAPQFDDLRPYDEF